MDGQPLSVLLIKVPRPGEKINTNEPVEIRVRSTDRIDFLGHVLPLEIQNTATRYSRTNVKRNNPKNKHDWCGETSMHNVRVKSLEHQVTVLQQNHRSGKQLVTGHSVWYNLKEIYASFMYHYGVDNFIFAMFGQMCSSSHRFNMHQFETTINGIRSVSFAVGTWHKGAFRGCLDKFCISLWWLNCKVTGNTGREGLSTAQSCHF